MRSHGDDAGWSTLVHSGENIKRPPTIRVASFVSQTKRASESDIIPANDGGGVGGWGDGACERLKEGRGLHRGNER